MRTRRGYNLTRSHETSVGQGVVPRVVQEARWSVTVGTQRENTERDEHQQAENGKPGQTGKVAGRTTEDTFYVRDRKEGGDNHRQDAGSIKRGPNGAASPLLL